MSDKVEKNEEYFKELIKNSFDMIVLMDASGIQHFVSESCETILGYKPEELIGIPVIENMLHPEDQDLTKKAFIDLLENKTNGGVQYRHINKNGTWVYLEAYGTNQLDNPLVKSVVLNVRDITKKKQEEKAIMKTLKEGVEQSKGLKGLIPICAACSLIRDDEKEGKPWVKPAVYINERLPKILFSHSMCPDCLKNWYPSFKDTND